MHPMAVSQEMHRPSITEMNLKITCMKFHSKLPGTYELNRNAIYMCDTASGTESDQDL